MQTYELRDTEEISGEVVVKHEVLDFISNGMRSETGVVAQTGTETALGVKHLAGGKCFFLLYQVDDVKR